MRTTTFITAVLATLCSAQNSTPILTQYTLTDDLTYDNFFTGFEFYSGPDPTQGFVRYQNATSAIEQNLVGFLSDTQSIFMGVDYWSVDPTGRASVRLESKKNWNHGLLLADIRHMPENVPGVWPAFWMLSGTTDWPNGGEIDIIEGVNQYERNAVTLHTSKGCMVDNSTLLPAGGSGAMDGPAGTVPFTGYMSTDDCDVAAEGQGKNVGCSIQAPDGIQTGGGSGGIDNDAHEGLALPSYGHAFNAAGGGIYAMEWTATFISVWFFPRESPSFTEHFGARNTSTGTTSPDPSAWGTPIAHFAGSGCDFSSRFKDLRIIFNVAFCGDWAGAESEWNKTSAAKAGTATCNEFVRDHPEAFVEAYWEIAGLKWFQKGSSE